MEYAINVKAPHLSESVTRPTYTITQIFSSLVSAHRPVFGHYLYN
jgi:hypothetical protein